MSGRYSNGQQLSDEKMAMYGGLADPDRSLILEGNIHSQSFACVAATAGTALAYTNGVAPRVPIVPPDTVGLNQPFRLVGFSVTLGNTVTADDTHYASWVVSAVDSAGANKTALATLTTKTAASGGTGNLTQYQTVFCSTNTGVCAAGGSIGFEITKSDGTGVSIPAGSIITLYWMMA